MTFKEYKAIWGEDGYCSLNELEDIRLNSNPRSYKAICKHWQKAIQKDIDEEYWILMQDMEKEYRILINENQKTEENI